MSIFDAAAMGLAYFAMEVDPVAIHGSLRQAEVRPLVTSGKAAGTPGAGD
jgi:hypothetical protein